jgi:pimeloyl-ACP methyl ester carboxylesterase
MLRILCLHGYHGSAEILRRQMAPLASSISGVEFVYVDAPSLVERDFGWWHSPARGWDRTRDWAIDVLGGQPGFDGVFGFSQGAALTGLLAGMQQASTVRFDFAVLVSGFKNDAPELAELYGSRFTVPSLHIISRTDGIVPPRESHSLAEQFENPVILEHSGGHIVPNTPAVVDGVNQFLSARAASRVEQ